MSPRPRRTRRHLALAALALVVGTSCAPTPQGSSCRGTTVKLRQDGVLSVGADLQFPPLAFRDPETGQPTGYEVELAGLVAEMVGLEARFQHRNASALVPGVVGQRHDLAASALRDSPELRSGTCLTRRYNDADLAVVARPGDPRGPQGPGELPGRVVGVVAGSHADVWTREHLGDTPSVPRYPTHDDLIAELRRGGIDAAIADRPLALRSQLESGDLEIVSLIDLDLGYVFVASPDNMALVALVNEALTDLEEDGRLAQLQRKWFGTEL